MNSATTHKMSFQADKGIVHISICGPIDNSSAHSIRSEAVNLAVQNSCKHFLYDLREARLGMTTIELYLLPRAFEEARGHKVAVLIRQDDEAEGWRFLETVERNLGIDMRIFIAESEAMDWLTAGSRSAG